MITYSVSNTQNGNIWNNIMLEEWERGWSPYSNIEISLKTPFSTTDFNKSKQKSGNDLDPSKNRRKRCKTLTSTKKKIGI